MITPVNSEAFQVRLDVFEGPFDLLLQLISKHKLDLTRLSLGRVTDDFIAHVQSMGAEWDLEEISSFVVVAATLLDLKAVRLLPGGQEDDPEDLAALEALEALEASDLLFARLLQYRAYKQVSFWVAARMESEERIWARPGGLEEEFAGLLPEVSIPGGLDGFVQAVVRAFTPAEEPTMPLEQLHLPEVSVTQQAVVLVARLRERGAMTFAELVAGADRITTVARFLALLELFRADQVGFEQKAPLAPLTVRWQGATTGEVQVNDEFDNPGESDEPSR